MIGLWLPTTTQGPETRRSVPLPLFRDWEHEWPLTAEHYRFLAKSHPGADVGYLALELWHLLAMDPTARTTPAKMEALVLEWIESQDAGPRAPLRRRLPAPCTDIELEALATATKELEIQRR